MTSNARNVDAAAGTARMRHGVRPRNRPLLRARGSEAVVFSAVHWEARERGGGDAHARLGDDGAQLARDVARRGRLGLQLDLGLDEVCSKAAMQQSLSVLGRAVAARGGRRTEGVAREPVGDAAAAAARQDGPDGQLLAGVHVLGEVAADALVDRVEAGVGRDLADEGDLQRRREGSVGDEERRRSRGGLEAARTLKPRMMPCRKPYESNVDRTTARSRLSVAPPYWPCILICERREEKDDEISSSLPRRRARPASTDPTDPAARTLNISTGLARTALTPPAMPPASAIWGRLSSP